MSGKAMPELVWSRRQLNRCLAQMLFQNHPHGPSGDPFPEFADKKRAAMNARLRPVLLNRFQGRRAYRDNPLLLPLADDANRFCIEIDVTDIESHQFA